MKMYRKNNENTQTQLYHMNNYGILEYEEGFLLFVLLSLYCLNFYNKHFYSEKI